MCGVSADELFRTAYENGKNDCMIEGLEFSAEELGYEIFTMSNGHNLAMFDKGKLRDLAEKIFITAIFAGQLTKAGLNSMLVSASESMVKALGTKGYTVLANKSTAKMLRGNMITGITSVVILSTGDIVNIFRGRISGGQLLKNVANTTATTVGGTVGWVAGSLIPIPVVGSIAGSVIGGALANKAAGTVLDNFVCDDADAMVEIIESVFVEIATEYLLTEHEVEDVVDYISKNITGKDLKNMYASNDREYYAKMLILPYVERKVSHKEHIKGIGAESFQRGLRNCSKITFHIACLFLR